MWFGICSFCICRLWGVAVLSSFLAAMGFACARRGRSYIVASSSGKTSGFDPLMDGSTPSATAVVLQPIFKRIGGVFMKKEYIKIPIDQLIPYENNPRKNEEAVPDVEESMNQVGNIDPIEIDENNVILSGHTRLLALQKLGETETEVLRVSGLTEEQKKKYRLLANKTGEKAGWDFEKLEEELADLDFGDFDFGFESESESNQNEMIDHESDEVPPDDFKEFDEDIKTAHKCPRCGYEWN